MRGLRRFLVAVVVCAGCSASERDPARLLETWRQVDTCRDLLLDGGAAVPREELGALWSAPTWIPTTAKGMTRTELEPVRHFLDGSSAAYDTQTGDLVAVYDDPKRGSYFTRARGGR